MQDWEKYSAIMSWYARRLGVSGILGFVLGFGVLIAYYTLLNPLQTSFNVKEKQNENRSFSIIEPIVSLPHISTAPTQIKTFLDLTNQYGLNVEAAQYDIEKNNEGSIIRYQVNFPLTSKYLPVKGFISAALSKIPGLSLDSIQLHRESAVDDVLEVDLTFSLYFLDN